MGLARNLRKTLNDWVDKILVELSCHYIKHLAKQTSRKQDNSSSMESSPNPMTQGDLPTTIATSSAGTSEKTIMMETEEIVADVRQWAIDKVQEYNGKGIDRIYDQMAIMAEFDEWFDPKEDLEVVSLDEITEELLSYREGCDIMMKQVGPKTYTGGTSTCECWVDWNNVKTYVQNKLTLSATQYQVEDKGLDATTHHKVWGSNYGAFEFKRQ